ncbi:MAG: serine protease [Bacillales bacterium]|nr:serine protease [Bacillales bacterium]
MKKRKTIFIKVFALVSMVILAITLAGCTFTNNTQTSEEAKNAYELAVENGFTGTLDEWLASLVENDSYESIYDLAVENGIFTGTLEEFIASLKGDPGTTTTEEAAAYAINSVVTVYADFNYTTSDNFFGGHTTTSSGTSGGAGVIIEDDKEEGQAYIITNYHVIYDTDSDEKISDSIYLFLYGMALEDYEIEAEYIGGSMTYDIAVLKIDSDIYKDSGAYPATVADSSDLSAGESVIAIGNPEAEGISVTAGIVSVPEEIITMTAADDTTELDFRVIRIDASINSGNSGGGLFNSEGELIGITNAKAVDTDVEGMGYAIPSNVAVNVAKNIMENCDGVTTTTINKVLLGVTVEVTASSASYNAETKTTSITQTIGVNEVTQSGVAYGILEAGDTLVSVTYGSDTYQIDSIYTVIDVLLQCSKDDMVNFYILRDGSYQTVTVTLSNTVAVS